MFNPFPGLRPFEVEEDHLFFGREKDVDALLKRLRTTRFLAVVGASGSGKSSLVRSGLIPSLLSGFMAGAGSGWRVAVMRPGDDPIGQLAAAIAAPDVLGDPDGLGDTQRILVETTLRRGKLGLVQAVQHARLPADQNVLVLVDQFEELFRFRRSRHANSRDDAVAFVRLLLEAAGQHERPVYVALTMRSDFIGDCMDFAGLPDAINDGLYLVGRMSRDSLRLAITGPVAVAEGAIAPRLVNRVLNDLGDDHDQLPRVQHALMRTWDHWAGRPHGDEPIDIADFEAVGGFGDALSRHAEEAYAEAAEGGGAQVVERLFKALTDTVTDPRGIRRPTTVADLAAVCDASDADVMAVVDDFRRAGRSFLMPPPAVALTPRSIIDLSHESLMRCWPRLITWADEERAAAEFYLRLSRASAWFAAGTAGLWRDPELALAERWRRDTQPTSAWARRYDDGFEQALAFLDGSVFERNRQAAEAERERRSRLRLAQGVAGVLATLLVFAVSFAYIAQRERARATANLELARDAVDESLASADRDPAQMAADLPQVEEFRRELLQKAERFYQAFMQQEPGSEQSQRDLALAHFRMGHINRMLERPDAAAAEYRDAIARFEALAAGYAGNPEYRQALAGAHNWLGETLRPNPAAAADAGRAYDRAFELQQALAQQQADRPQYQQDLARTLYNRGILRAGQPGGEAAAGADFREAIRLLRPLAATIDRAAQELARALNNLAALTLADASGAAEAQALYGEAIGLNERLLARDADNREYRLELATYCNNLASLLHEMGQADLARQRSRQAIGLMDDLARLAPSLAIERADARNLQGLILQATDAAAAAREFGEALDQFAALQADPLVLARPDYHLRFGDLLLYLAAPQGRASNADMARLLSRAVGVYAEVAGRIAASGPGPAIPVVVETLARVVPALPGPERARLQGPYDALMTKGSGGR